MASIIAEVTIVLFADLSEREENGSKDHATNPAVSISTSRKGFGSYHGCPAVVDRC